MSLNIAIARENKKMIEFNKQYIFKPNFSIVNEINGFYEIKDLEKEIGVYSASPDFINKNCGDISRHILSKIPDWYYKEADELGLYPNCDIRIHRLYPSDYPAYPGFHCDAEFRETYFSQPDLDRINTSKNIILTCSSSESGVSNTQFLDEEYQFSSSYSPDFPLWQQINKELDKKQCKTTFDSKDGQLIMFDNWTLHRVMPAKTRGWRLFFRMSMWHRPNLGNGGMITKQETVYKYISDAGW